MSWHTSALVVEGDHVESGEQLLAHVGLPGKHDIGAISGDDAGSSGLEGRAIGLAKGWTLVWDPMLFVPDEADDVEGMFQTSIWTAAVDNALAQLSRTSRVYSFIVEGSSDTYGFAWYVAGQRQRLWLSQEGAVAMEEGTPLAEERAAAAEQPDEEQRMFLLMHKLTGVSVQDADSVSYRLFA